MTIRHFQHLMEQIYGARDKQRGASNTFRWLVEEIGELAQALRHDSQEQITEEIADVFAWLASLANLQNVDIETALQQKYPGHCPRCSETPCRCDLTDP